ncbi:UDP-N-acetylmuramate dehydrogenase [Nakamurella aerolata]|uniref:UDP-N-acetylmuramate dehydrogenase n=1 Tax=Nakamurella aerolata TaxID=1656892 RepID=UPI003CCD5FFB
MHPTEPSRSSAPARPPLLSELTTLGLGGPARELIRVRTREQVAQAVGGRDVLVLGGGSNLVVADAGVDLPVVKIELGGITEQPAPDPAAGIVLVTLGAGLVWDDVVADLTARGYAELAPLSGIPGAVGATPVQNVGAYGVEIADLLERVTVFDRASVQIRSVPAADLGLGYRTSVLRGTDAAVVLDVTFALASPGSIGTVARYPELARSLNVEPGERADPAAVREAVLALRRGKGMVLDPDDPDTRSAGSFFTNPIVPAADAPGVLAAITAKLGDVPVPQWPAAVPGAAAGDPPGTKLSAAWLIDRAGFGKGFAGPGGRVAISSKHTLALTNRGGASTADLVALARQVRDGVHAAFGVRLEPEPVFVGVSLDDAPVPSP